MKEKIVMAHRYLYYVKCTPVISDYEYDKLEAEAIAEGSELLKTPGSDLETSYTNEIKQLAHEILS